MAIRVAVDALGGDHAPVEVGPAEEDRGDRLGGGCDGAREDLAGRVVAAQGVDRDAGRH